MKKVDRPGGGSNVVRRAVVRVHRSPGLTSDKRAVTVRDAEDSRFNLRKSNTFDVVYSDANVSIARHNYKHGDDAYEYGSYYSSQSSQDRRYHNNSTLIFPNYDETGEMSQVEQAVKLSKFSRIVPVAITTVLTALSAWLMLSVSLWWMPAVLVTLTLLVLMMTLKYTYPFMPRIDTRESFECSGDELAVKLSNLLSTHPKAARISSLIRAKCEIEDDELDALNWCWTLCDIFEMEPEYNVDVIPLMNDDLNEVFDKVDEIDRRMHSVESIVATARAESATQKALALDELERLAVGRGLHPKEVFEVGGAANHE